MATPNMENVWEILEKYNIEIKSTCQEVICIMCKKILVKPRVALCGCTYCYNCYTKNLNNQGQCCVGETEQCRTVMFDNYEKFFNDDRINFKIAKMVVNCPGKSCTFKTPLEEMSDHIKTCEMEPKMLESYRSKFGYFEIQKKMETLENILNGIEANQDCSKVTILEMNNSIKEVKEIVEFNNNRNQKQLAEQEQLLKRNNEKMEKVFETLNEKLKQLETILMNAVTRLDEKCSGITALLETKLTQIQANQNCGELVWCIKNWGDKLKCATDNLKRTKEKSKPAKDKLKSAEDQIVTEFYSEPFYSQKNGYKICLELNPVNSENPSHLSLYVCIMRGEFDDILPWPFRDGVKLELLDSKSHGAYISQNVTYKDNPSHVAWKKPVNKRNTGIGFPDFIELSKLGFNGEMCREDQIWIRATFLTP